MIGPKRTLIMALGVLVLTLVLAGCQTTAGNSTGLETTRAAANGPIGPAATITVAGDPIAPDAVKSVPASEAGEQVKPQPTAVEGSYQEGFTEEGDPFRGDPSAPVTIVEFSDYQCPFCERHFQQTWPQLKAEFVDTGRVRYVFKDFPLTSIHPQAHKAHEAARCAGEQGAYWAMHDRIFAGQKEWAGQSDPVSIFKDYAAELELGTTAFDTCLDSGRWVEAVNTDMTEGASLGIRGTPTFFINGYPFVGAQPYQVFQQAIRLAEQGKLGETLRSRP